MDEWKRSGKIPAFGNWDFANELPITQYFECARQAGLIRYSSSSGERSPYINVHTDRDLYAVDAKKQNKKGMRGNRERRCCTQHHNNVSKEMRKEQVNVNVNDVTEQQRKQQMRRNDVVPRSAPHNQRPKPVDEDLYKIPPELLRTTKRKKMLGFISKCLVPAACVS
ncbi:hypothetical protein TanjilG_02484 [Lupinus angustifolius]|uniref:RIN4 pathogenic type III effector avirulence factor Avr cleavage site domain-containing protein n=1 Tax=Lupinus angustifolius TaxID=3871 RepID=A0A394DE09_LUPAN|nr:PREDICTED: uncharacterized protein LOC109339806 [Lupinus angustifolius]OIW21375.1 hypothetical protein TanjilG_02484 [Lupinus angustifolius]